MRLKHKVAWSLVAAVALAVKDAFAQGCASCYTTTAAGGAQTIHALRSGIVVLLAPPVLIFAGLVLAAWCWRTSAGTEPKMSARNGYLNFDEVCKSVSTDSSAHAAWQHAEIASSSEE